jgi:hypothetical protein
LLPTCRCRGGLSCLVTHPGSVDDSGQIVAKNGALHKLVHTALVAPT